MKRIFKLFMGTLLTIIIITPVSFATEIAVEKLPIFAKIVEVFKIFYEHWNFIVAIFIYTILIYFIFSEIQKESRKELMKDFNKQKEKTKKQSDVIIGMKKYFDNYLDDVLTNIETHFDEDFQEHEKILEAISTLKTEDFNNKKIEFKTNTEKRIRDLNDTIKKYQKERRDNLNELIKSLENESTRDSE